MSWQAPTFGSWRRRLKVGILSLLGLILVVGAGGLVYALYPRTMPQTQTLAARLQPVEIERLRLAAEFNAIADPRARSVALFEEAGRVIQHPRCMNCHPRTDRPTQTDGMRAHTPWVTRGVDGSGASTLRCSTCHQAENFEASGVPGNINWKLAPTEMAWQGETLGDICRQLLDPARSHMTREELLHHMTEDELVGWAWHPGANRRPAPGSQAEFGALIKAWLETGAACPP
ncbi:Isoquinoline 1-oxidoreductase subunit [Sinorhizobium meliloti]|uniref:Isoquinoline 1-oxidoreductase subunit n=1 Tax=Rhizobium meliloti TaxID=382 RepID=UPI00129652C5|nr:Isoquinoline 1-oxidoreductase subunit [Sinorhizobium meliloti]